MCGTRVTHPSNGVVILRRQAQPRRLVAAGRGAAQQLGLAQLRWGQAGGGEGVVKADLWRGGEGRVGWVGGRSGVKMPGSDRQDNRGQVKSSRLAH